MMMISIISKILIIMISIIITIIVIIIIISIIAITVSIPLPFIHLALHYRGKRMVEHRNIASGAAEVLCTQTIIDIGTHAVGGTRRVTCGSAAFFQRISRVPYTLPAVNTPSSDIAKVSNNKPLSAGHKTSLLSEEETNITSYKQETLAHCNMTKAKRDETEVAGSRLQYCDVWEAKYSNSKTHSIKALGTGGILSQIHVTGYWHRSPLRVTGQRQIPGEAHNMGGLQGG